METIYTIQVVTSMGRSCDYAGDAEPTLLGIDYVKAYHCTFGELGVFFYPALLGWACFLTYLRK